MNTALNLFKAYSGEIKVAVCSTSSALTMMYIMDDYYNLEIRTLKRNYEAKLTMYNQTIKELESQKHHTANKYK